MNRDVGIPAANIGVGVRYMRLCSFLRAAATAGFASCCGAAFAASSTATMNVSIAVTAACNVSVTDINFGSVPATTLAASLTSTAGQGGLFTYTCGPTSTTPALTAGQGQNYSGANRMKGALGGFIPYSLNVPAVAAFTGVAQTAQITATIPAQATLPAADSYTDAVVLTLTY
jgi:spore coat protein U-like protein